MTKTLYSETQLYYNSDGSKLANEIGAALLPIFRDRIQQGFSLHEISGIAHKAVMGCEGTIRVDDFVERHPTMESPSENANDQ